MVLTIKQKLFAAAIGFSAFFAAVLMLLCLPSTSYAAPLGEHPHIYFTYEQGGELADPDNLSAGETYDVKIWLRGMQHISTFQITATVDDTVTYAVTPTALMSDNVADISSMGYVLTNGNIVFGFVSDNADYSTINPDGTLVAELTMTFAQAGDAWDHISVSENPNLTFAQADYNDGFDEAYALDPLFEGYTEGALSPMTCDVSPKLAADGYTINGVITIASDKTGAASAYGVEGLTVIVADGAGTTVASDVTSENGEYTLVGLPAGEYTLTITGPTTVDREVALVVSESKTVDAIGVVICDYNLDKAIDSTDFTKFLSYYGTTGKEHYSDFNGDSATDSTDFTAFLKFYGASYDDLGNTAYANVTLR